MKGRREGSLLEVGVKLAEAIGALRSRHIEVPPALLRAVAILSQHNERIAAARRAHVSAVRKLHIIDHGKVRTLMFIVFAGAVAWMSVAHAKPMPVMVKPVVYKPSPRTVKCPPEKPCPVYAPGCSCA
jgi:hypothetical protein